MSDTVLANSQADLNGKTVLVAETAAVISGGLTPSADSVPIGFLRRATVTLTDAQVKTLPTTGVVLVAAPAAALRVKMIGATIIADTVAGAYTNIDATYAALTIEGDNDAWLTVPVVNDSTSAPALTMLTDLLTGGVVPMLVDLPAPYAGVPSTTTNGWVTPQAPAGVPSFEAIAATLMFDNGGSGNLTGGNAANTLKVTVYYVLEAV